MEVQLNTFIDFFGFPLSQFSGQGEINTNENTVST